MPRRSLVIASMSSAMRCAGTELCWPLVGQLTFILMRERPHVVVAPGAAPGMVALALANFPLRSRTMCHRN
jgi:hypothetical protein